MLKPVDPVGSKKIEKDTNFWIKNNTNYLSFPSIHFASIVFGKVYFSLPMTLSAVFTMAYLFLYMALSVMPYPFVSTFFNQYLSINHLETLSFSIHQFLSNWIHPVLQYSYPFLSTIYRYSFYSFQSMPKCYILIHFYSSESALYVNILIYLYPLYIAVLSIHLNPYPKIYIFYPILY